MSSLARALRPLEFFFTQYKRVWRGTAVTSVVTPVVYLLALGVGLGVFVNRSTNLPDGISYLAFVAPGLMAATAMQLATFEASWPVLSAIKWDRQYHAMLATPLGPTDVALGEMGWALLRGTIYAGAFLLFMVILGLTSSPWAILCLPCAMLIGFAFAGAGMACTTFMRSFVDFDYVNIVLLPLFLFSGIFFPLTQYPTGVQWVVRCTPLYQGVALERALA